MEAPLIIAIILAVAQMIYNGLLGLFMFGLRRKFAQHDDLRVKVEQRDETIRAQVDAAVDQKIGTLEQLIARIEKRLQDGDLRIEKLGLTDHQAELKNTQEIHKLWLYVTEHCATKTGLDGLGKQIAALREDVIRVESNRGAA